MEVWAGSSVYYPIISVRKCAAAWPCSTTCWNQSRGFHGMRCCSGITWRNSPKITQIMSSLAVSMLRQCLCQSINFFIMCPQSTNYHIYMVTLCISVSVCLWLVVSVFNVQNESSFVSFQSPCRQFPWQPPTQTAPSAKLYVTITCRIVVYHCS